MLHAWVRVRPGNGRIISIILWSLLRVMKLYFTGLVENWPQENIIEDRDFANLALCSRSGSGGFRLMGRLPEGLSAYLASS